MHIIQITTSRFMLIKRVLMKELRITLFGTDRWKEREMILQTIWMTDRQTDRQPETYKLPIQEIQRPIFYDNIPPTACLLQEFILNDTGAICWEISSIHRYKWMFLYFQNGTNVDLNCIYLYRLDCFSLTH